MPCLNSYHDRLRPEKINPFLCIAIIHQKVLSYKRIPCIALIQVKSFIKARLFPRIGGEVIFHELNDACFVLFIAGMSMFYKPAVQLQGKIGKPGYYIDMAAYLVRFNR